MVATFRATLPADLLLPNGSPAAGRLRFGSVTTDARWGSAAHDDLVLKLKSSVGSVRKHVTWLPDLVQSNPLSLSFPRQQMPVSRGALKNRSTNMLLQELRALSLEETWDAHGSNSPFGTGLVALMRQTVRLAVNEIVLYTSLTPVTHVLMQVADLDALRHQKENEWGQRDETPVTAPPSFPNQRPFKTRGSASSIPLLSDRPQPASSAYVVLDLKGIVPSMTGRVRDPRPLVQVEPSESASDIAVSGRTPGHTPELSSTEGSFVHGHGLDSPPHLT